jgi:hypothetical protein
MGALKGAIAAFHERGEFSEEQYKALRTALAPASGHSDSQTFDGLVGLFFERHLLNDRRRTELIAMDDEALGRAVRHRFRQLVADEAQTHKQYHALSPHVREALQGMPGAPPSGAAFPATIQSKAGFSGVAVEQAVAALWGEWQRKPSTSEATGELLKRYLTEAPRDEITESREFPEVVRARLDAQRLARGILNVFSGDERDLLRAVLDGQSVDEWAQGKGTSRATAYRLYARLKTLCQLELKERSHRTQLEAIDAMRGQLKPPGQA